MPFWQRLLDESSPQARELFETGLAYLRSGKYGEARLSFQTLVRAYSGDKAEPLGYWAIALSHYREGGDENLLLALDDFRNYLLFFPNDPNLQELAEAAQIDTTVIYRELMDSSLTEETKLGATRTSLQALTQFLNGYPNSPSSDLAKTQVAQIKQFLPAGSAPTIVLRMMRVFPNSTQGAPIEQYLVSGQVNTSVIAIKIVTQNQNQK